MMPQALFQQFCQLAQDKAGINLRPGKEELVSARVAKRQRALGIEDPKDYLEYLHADSSGEELVHFLDAISTNFTSFLREPDHFHTLTEWIKRWMGQGQRSFKIWSAASSSGEEPYSLAITMRDILKNGDGDFRILATDISTRVLATARAGVYPASRLEPLSQNQRGMYFSRVPRPEGAEEDHFQVRPDVRSHLVFSRLNLSTPPFPMKGPFDVVFCRNVLIYFDQPVRQGLLTAIETLLRPGGLLCIGHTETLTGVRCGMKMLRPSVFVKTGDPATEEWARNNREITARVSG